MRCRLASDSEKDQVVREILAKATATGDKLTAEGFPYLLWYRVTFSACEGTLKAYRVTNHQLEVLADHVQERAEEILEICGDDANAAVDLIDTHLLRGVAQLVSAGVVRPRVSGNASGCASAIALFLIPLSLLLLN